MGRWMLWGDGKGEAMENTIDQVAKDILWECLLHELGGGEGENVARALINAAQRLGLTEDQALDVYDWL